MPCRHCMIADNPRLPRTPRSVAYCVQRMMMNPLLGRSVLIGNDRKHSTTTLLFFRRKIIGQHSKNSSKFKIYFWNDSIIFERWNKTLRPITFNRAVQEILSCSLSKVPKLLVKKGKHCNFFFLNLLQISIEMFLAPSLWGQAR